jgi:Toprim domain-containing protein
VPHELMFQACDRRRSFVVALDNDAAGERGWVKAWDDTVDWAGFRISPECPTYKDWNDDLVLYVAGKQPRTTSLLRL